MIALFTAATFYLADQEWPLFIYNNAASEWVLVAGRVANRMFWYVVLPLAVLALLYYPRSAWRELGLGGSLAGAFRVAGLCTLPMLLGYAVLADFQWTLNWRQLVLTCLLAAFAEEVLYRGFLFGQLFRRVGLPFFIAALPMALFFGLGHLYQSNEVGETIGIFLVTLLGGLWFSWLYIAWNENLWVPIAFHLLMNLYWTAFSAGDNALGGLWPNLFRMATIALSIWLTLRQAPGARFSLFKRPPTAEEPVEEPTA